MRVKDLPLYLVFGLLAGLCENIGFLACIGYAGCANTLIFDIIHSISDNDDWDTYRPTYWVGVLICTIIALILKYAVQW